MPTHPTATGRLATDSADFTAAARLLVDFNSEYGDPAPAPDWLAGHLEQLTRSGTASVLLAGEPAAGVAVLRFRTSTWSEHLEAYLAEFYVSPGRRDQGIGTAFLDAVIDHAVARGATYLDLTTTEADEAARHVYEKRGFDCHEGRGSGARSLYYELDLS